MPTCPKIPVNRRPPLHPFECTRLLICGCAWLFLGLLEPIPTAWAQTVPPPTPNPLPTEHRSSKSPPVSFTQGVAPMFDRMGCNTVECHGALRGKGGLKLSLFGADPESDFLTLTKAGAGRYVNRIEPETSLLLLKATATIPHAGSRTIKPDSPQYQTLSRWIAQGATYTYPGEPQLLALRTTLHQLILYPGETAKLEITGSFSDGSTRNLASEAKIRSTDLKIAAIEANATVKAADPGEAFVIASHLRKSEVLRIIVPIAQRSAAPEPPSANKIDELVTAKLRLLGIAPSADCSEVEFLRRAYLQTIGILPTPDQARAYLAGTEPARRSKLIDRLLEREEFADFWALKWGDILRIKSEYPVRVWPKGVETYYRWVRESIAKNKPYDQFARELITSGGSDFHDGASNFYRALPTKDPQSIAENVALVFMGARLGCARCHGHPDEAWDVRDDLGMAAFFAKIGYKSTQEWKEEIVIFNPKGIIRDPKTREIVKAKFLGGPVVEFEKEEDPREKFAAWLTAPENRWFAKAIANRVWFWLFNRGIVNEPDDLRPTNPPENPELLDFLAQELTSHRYDLKHLYRLILNSHTWQRSSATQATNAGDAAHFSHYPIIRLGAEQLSDAISQLTETSEKFQSIIPEPFTYLPPGHRATQISDGNIGVPFLELFGRPPRDTPFENERSSTTSLWQALYLLNSDQLETKIATSPRIKRLIAAGNTNEAIVEEFYLAALSRPPTPNETRKLMNYITAHKANRAQAIGDIVWALLNTKEFMFIR